MRRLTYWISHCIDDSPAYSIRRRTRKEVRDALDELGDHSHMSEPCKITVEYDSVLGLLSDALGEGGLYEEESSRHEAQGKHYE